MATFTVLCSLKGPVRIAGVMNLSLMADDVLAITSTYNLLRYDALHFHEAGLRCEVSITTTDIDTAVRAAERAVERIVPLFALSAASEIPTALVEMAYDSTPSALSGEMVRFAYGAAPESRIRKVSFAAVGGLFVDLAEQAPRHRKAIERALWWYNLALTQERSANRFSMLWIAL